MALRPPPEGGLIHPIFRICPLQAPRLEPPDISDTLEFNKGQSLAGREWHVWLPIKQLTERQVFEVIAKAGQKPHWVYAKGMRRCSCVFCIYATAADHQTAAPLAPDLYRRYCATEQGTGKTLVMPTKQDGARTLQQITGITPTTEES